MAGPPFVFFEKMLSMQRCNAHPLPYAADPAVYFRAFHHVPGAILLDSGRPTAERGRFDVLSAWPLTQLTPNPDESGQAFFSRARQALDSLGQAQAPEGVDTPFTGGLLGFLSYDFGRRLEKLPQQAAKDLALTDSLLGLYDWAIVTDHTHLTSQLITHPSVTPERQQWLISQLANSPIAGAAFKLMAPFKAQIRADFYQQQLAKVQDYIRAGDCYQINYTQRFEAPFQGDPWPAYCALRKACPTPFAGFLRISNDTALLSLSPERFVKVDQQQVETRPIKGTRPRGKTPAEDQQLAKQLLASAKDRAENLMIVDLLRNDLGRICATGSVKVPELFSLESYPNVHHLVSSVTGTLKEGCDGLDLLSASFPGGSITGAPKIRAMQIIDELEPSRRGPYCGSLLYLDVRGQMDSSITIRTLLAENGQLYCWGGGGIVADSVTAEEYQESLDKVSVLLNTLETQFI